MFANGGFNHAFAGEYSSGQSDPDYNLLEDEENGGKTKNIAQYNSLSGSLSAIPKQVC